MRNSKFPPEGRTDSLAYNFAVYHVLSHINNAVILN